MAKGGGTSPSKKKRYETNKATKRREKNKLRKLLKHLKSHPKDTLGQETASKLQAIISQK